MTFDLNDALITQTNIRYLLVDDDHNWLQLIKDLLSNPALALCQSPQEALEVLDALPIELVITDTNMGAMSGVDLLREIRSQTRWNSVSVIVLFSGLAGSDIKKTDLIEMGASFVVSKEEFLSSWPHFFQQDLGRLMGRCSKC